MDKNCIYKSDRADGRFLDSFGQLHYYLKHMDQKLAFDPGMSPEEFKAWYEQVRLKAKELMTFPEDVPTQPKPELLWEKPRDGYRVQKWETYPEPGFAIRVLILIPDGISAQNPGPAVMCFPGSSASKELLAGEPEENPLARINKHPEHNKMAYWYVKAGLTAVAVDNPDLGECLEPFKRELPSMDGRSRNLLADIMIYGGRSYLGFSVFQKMKILAWLRTLAFIDPENIAVSGMSLGTEPAMVMGVLDSRIKAMVFNDCVVRKIQSLILRGLPHIGVWHTVPGFLQWFDFPDFLAAFAPRPLLLLEGGFTSEIRKVQSAYRLLDQEEQCEIHYYDKYATPDKRKHDDDIIPEGLTRDEYLEYANVDAKNHFFKEYLAVPWLTKVLSVEK